MNKFLVLTAGSMAFAAITTSPASAEAIPDIFQERPVSDELLSQTRGASAMLASWSVGRVTSIVDANARNDLRFLGSSGQYQMDIWWSTVGSELIAQSVRGTVPK